MLKLSLISASLELLPVLKPRSHLSVHLAAAELTAFLTSLSVIPFAFCSSSTMVTQVRRELHGRSAAMPVLPPAWPISSVGCSAGQSFAEGKHAAAQGTHAAWEAAADTCRTWRRVITRPFLQSCVVTALTGLYRQDEY